MFLFLGGFLLGCHEVFPPLNDLFSQGSQQGTLMPELPNDLYEQLSYHKILPLVSYLSMEISYSGGGWNGSRSGSNSIFSAGLSLAKLRLDAGTCRCGIRVVPRL